VTRTGVRS